MGPLPSHAGFASKWLGRGVQRDLSASAPCSSLPRSPISNSEEDQPLASPCNTEAEEQRRLANRKRAAQALQYKHPYLKEVKNAHAENRESVIQIPVSSAGTVLGMKTPLHRATRLCARQTLNLKIRSYKAKSDVWNSQLELIASKLSTKFVNSNPLSNAYLGKFLRTADAVVSGVN